LIGFGLDLCRFGCMIPTVGGDGVEHISRGFD
jgi:hypothetical protein